MIVKRQDKYPDTDTFHFFNANPKGKITGDCVVRAISRATGIDYNTVVMELAAMQCKTGLDYADKRIYGKYLENHGFVKCGQPRKADSTKYTGKEFCRKLADKKARYFAHIGGLHVVAIIDGRVNDHWDSTGGCIGNYWVKEDAA